MYQIAEPQRVNEKQVSSERFAQASMLGWRQLPATESALSPTYGE